MMNCPDDGGSMHLWNVGLLQRDCTALYARLSSSCSPPWEPEVSQAIALFFVSQMKVKQGGKLYKHWNESHTTHVLLGISYFKGSRSNVQIIRATLLLFISVSLCISIICHINKIQSKYKIWSQFLTWNRLLVCISSLHAILPLVSDCTVAYLYKCIIH
jgi:hypothetical protein